MPGFLPFAGAFHVHVDERASRRWTILPLATVGVPVSTAAGGLMTWARLHAAGVPARPVYCPMFRALLSPTDPIAVMAVLRRAGVPKDMEIKIAGESLFDDGVAVVASLGLVKIATKRAEAAVGFGLAWVTYRMLRSVDHYPDTGGMLLRFCEGRPVSATPEEFLGWVCERLAGEGKWVLVLVWDNAAWHVSTRVREWVGRHHRQVSRAGAGCRIRVCPRPIKPPWRNPIEPTWVHGKRAIVEPDRTLTADEVRQRACDYYGCKPQPLLAKPAT
jgi:hypothetical protein